MKGMRKMMNMLDDLMLVGRGYWHALLWSRIPVIQPLLLWYLHTVTEDMAAVLI
jgi:hypothetical protein